jgi:hypothetical protein
MMAKRNEILSELENTRQALRASEKRGRRAVRRSRDLEKVLEPIKQRMEMWANMPLPDEQNAAKVMTIGDCRKLLALLNGEAPDEPDTDETVDEQKAA